MTPNPRRGSTLLSPSTWRRCSLRVITVAVAFPFSGLIGPTVSQAQSEDYITKIQPPKHEFVNGFAELYEQLGTIVMGVPVEAEHATDDAEAVQLTSKGLAVWKAGEAPSFTDGWRTYRLASPTTLSTAAVPASPSLGPPVGIWDRLAQCESTGNWAS